MNILLNKGRNNSGALNINLVAHNHRTYIFDNHAAAIWCWSQLDLSKSYNLLHIDRHYDLIRYDDRYSEIHNIELANSAISDLTQHKVTLSSESYQFFRWDNYINLFIEKYPKIIRSGLFLTQKNGDFSFSKEAKEIEFYELFSEILDKNHKWIVNIDVDYFFSCINDKTVRVFSDEYIMEFSNWLGEISDNIAMITVCLSPECCGGWEQAKNVAELILDIQLDI